MNLIAQRIKEIFPHWNKRSFTEIEAYEFCEKEKIILVETDLIDAPGEFRIHREKPFILIHKFIQEHMRAWILWHEIAHYVLHSPLSAKFSASTVRIIDLQANYVAVVALIPKKLLKTKTLFEIQDEFGFPKNLIMLRKEIYDTFKV